MRQSGLALLGVMMLFGPALAQKPPAPAKNNTVPLIRTALLRKAEVPEILPDPQIKLETVLNAMATKYSLKFVINVKAFQAEGQNNPADLGVVQEKALQACPNLNSFLRQVMTRVTNQGAIPSGALFVLRRDHIEITTGAFLARDRTPSFPLMERAALLRGIQQTTASLGKRGEFPEIAADPQTKLAHVLNALARRQGVQFEINAAAFEMEAVKEVEDSAVVGEKALPAAKNVTLAKYLESVLSRVMVPSGAIAVPRFDHIEITTKAALLREKKGGAAPGGAGGM